MRAPVKQPARASWRDTAFLLGLALGPALAVLGLVAFFALAVRTLP